MAKTNRFLRLDEIDLPLDARVLLYMENRKSDKRKTILTGEESETTRNSKLKDFAAAIVSSVVKCGKDMRIVYLDEARTAAYTRQLAQTETGEQLTL